MKLLNTVKASRRGFFGLSAGGVLSGKAAFNEVANEAVMRVKYMGPGRFSGDVVGDSNDDWKAKAIKRLRSVVAGRLTPEQKMERRLERMSLAKSVIQVEALGLRSISDGAKMRLLSKRMIKRSAEVERLEARKRLLYDFGVPEFLVEDDERSDR